MKIAIASDVHLEFGDLILKNEENADVLILSGDICVAADFRESDPYGIVEHGKSQRYYDFFSRCVFEFPKVIYVAGNHEHYNGDYAETFKILRNYLGRIENLHILDKEHVIIDDVTFIGGTLWTDMNAQDPVTLAHIRGIMNDFRIIQNSAEMVSYKTMVNAYDGDGNVKLDENGQPIQQAEFHKRPARFTPEDTVQDHKKMLEYIQVTTAMLGENSNKYVVVGHHAPSKASTHPRYQTEVIMNGAYSSRLDQFILDNPQIKLWTHGHTHEDFDYMIGSTRVVCNPRGYINYEDRADDFKLKYVEI
jgi:Icc-related predicted phosphoesterase